MSMDTCSCFLKRVNTCTYLLSSNVRSVLNQTRTKPSTQHVFSDPLSREQRTVVKVVGDGNCFFRAISAFFLESEAFHLDLRKATCNFMIKHRNTFCTFSGNFPQHVQNMLKTSGERSSWGTHIELFAVATMFQAPVYVYCDYADTFQWLR
jgi:hypothetical protein